MAATNKSRVQAALKVAGSSKATTRLKPGDTVLHSDAAHAPHDRGKDVTDPGFLASRMLNAPEGTFEDTLDWSKLTCNGQPIPRKLWGQMLYAMTDQAAAERAAKRTTEPAMVTVLADASDKRLERYIDGAKNDIDPWDNPDPMKELADRVVAPDEAPRFLSPNVIKNSGLRGWEPKLVDKNGIKEPVSVNGMVLATMPKERKKSRDRHFAAKADAAMVKASDAEREETEKAIALTLGRRRKVSAVDKGLETYRGDPANMEDRDFSIPGVDRASL
jgi:hypothetical protein